MLSYQPHSLALLIEGDPTSCGAELQQPFALCILPPPLYTLSTLLSNTLQVLRETEICFKEFHNREISTVNSEVIDHDFRQPGRKPRVAQYGPGSTRSE